MKASREYRNPKSRRLDDVDRSKRSAEKSSIKGKEIADKGEKIGSIPRTNFVIYRYNGELWRMADRGQGRYDWVEKVSSDSLPKNMTVKEQSIDLQESPIAGYMKTLKSSAEKAYAQAMYDMLNQGTISKGFSAGLQISHSSASKIKNDVTTIVVKTKLGESLLQGTERLYEENAPANSVGSAPGNIAGVSDNDPPVKQKKVVRRKFAGTTVFEVDSETFNKCRNGHMKYERWDKYLNRETSVGEEIHKYAKNYPSRDIIVQREGCGTMQYIKRKGVNH